MESPTPPSPDPQNGFFSRRRWLARLSMSFLIVAALLAYRGYRAGQTHDLSPAQASICYIAAAMAFALFLMGVREKHRPMDDQ